LQLFQQFAQQKNGIYERMCIRNGYRVTKLSIVAPFLVAQLISITIRYYS